MIPVCRFGASSFWEHPQMPLKQQSVMHLRIHRQLHRRLGDAAKQRGVSATREVNDRLARSFDKDPIVGLAADVKRMIATLRDRETA
jgi:hypothetical protein